MTKVIQPGCDKLPDFTICAVVSIREQKQRSTCGARIDLQLPIPKLKVRTTRESGCLRASRSGSTFFRFTSLEKQATGGCVVAAVVVPGIGICFRGAAARQYQVQQVSRS